MPTTYYASAADIDISFWRALVEYQRHGLTEEDLLSDLGACQWYAATDVLDALGY